MASADLMKLYQLHLIDVGILEVRKKAAALEAGKKIQDELVAFQHHVKGVEDAFHKVHGEQKDIELSNQQIDDKVANIEKLLFGGKVTSPKEVEAYETQIKGLKAQKDQNEDKLVGLWDEVAKAESAFKEAQTKLKEKSQAFEEWKKKAVTFKAQLEAHYKDLAAKRPAALQGINPTLIATYEAIKKQHGGIGVAMVTKEQTCQECGTKVPDKTIESIKDDRTATCEECRRILYWTSGLI